MHGSSYSAADGRNGLGRVEQLAPLRPSGGSLTLAVAFRILSLPMLSAVGVTSVTDSRTAGAATFCWLLAVELVARRHRWAWQRLDRLPAIDEPPPNQADAHRLAWHYIAGTVLLGSALAVWKAASGEALEHLPQIGAIVVAIGSAIAGQWLFEHFVRSRGSTLRTRLAHDGALDVGEMGLFVMLLPKRWWRGGATFVALATAIMLGGMFGMIVLGADALWTSPTYVFFVLPAGMAFVALSAAVLSMIEAINTTSFIEAHGDNLAAGLPTVEPTST